MMKSEKARKAINFQLVVMIISLIFIILSFVIKVLANYREIVLGIILLVMAYTNYVVYDKKKIGGWSLRSTAFARWLPIQNNMKKDIGYWKYSPIGWLLDVDLYQLMEDYK